MAIRQQSRPVRDPIQLTRHNVAHHRSEFERLSRRYAQLAWATSANEQRERVELETPLMDLYVALHPGTVYSQFDDFDVVVRRHQPA